MLCDGHAVVAEALAPALGGHGFLVRPVTTLAGALAAVRDCGPRVLVVERALPDGDALAALPSFAAAAPGTRVVVLTGAADGASVRRALAAGAAGYLHKTCAVRDLAHALHRVLDGEVVVEVPTGRAPRQAPDTAAAHALAAHLTPRERECLALLVEGAGTAAMASGLGVSATTVRTHVRALLTKLGVHSRVEAAALAVRHRLLSTPPGRATGT
ncbi:response regulator transcription factor [Actinokineospora bangkokensis]|uniref:response regulator transcription factor n=1 Tax=Actinokineospora bangkokensis TaxID=1193682 RepID=UPI000AFA9CE2|nr:response regulator transcription factor [Actinokineospora bangkokensis]